VTQRMFRDTLYLKVNGAMLVIDQNGATLAEANMQIKGLHI
jgi:hypothetical protein